MKVGFASKEIEGVNQKFVVFKFEDGYSARYPIASEKDAYDLIDEMCKNNTNEASQNDCQAA